MSETSAEPVDERPLKVLLETARDLEPGLSTQLLRKCYEIQRARQYDRDEVIRFDLTHRAVEISIAEAPREGT